MDEEVIKRAVGGYKPNLPLISSHNTTHYVEASVSTRSATREQMSAF